MSSLSVLSVMLVYCGQKVGWINMKLGMQVGLGPGDIVLDEDPAPLPKKGVGPKFSAHVYCGQTTGWIKMPVGTKVGLGPGDIVFDVDPAPPPRVIAPQFLGPCLLWSLVKRLDGSRRHMVRRLPRHRPHCVTGDPASPTRGTVPPQFSAHVYCDQMVASPI